MKRCNACGEEKPLGEIVMRRGAHVPLCKVCNRRKSAAWRDANRDRHRAKSRESYERRTEDVKALLRADRAANPDKYRDQHKRRYESVEVREKVRLRNARYYAANRERLLEYEREWRKKNPEKDYARAMRSYHTRRARLAGDKYAQKIDRAAIWERDGGICQLCHEPAGENWEMDHIVPLSVEAIHAWYNVRVLCFHCNRSKWAKLDGQVALPV